MADNWRDCAHCDGTGKTPSGNQCLTCCGDRQVCIACCLPPSECLCETNPHQSVPPSEVSDE